jgi:hypothetical protein
MRTIALGETGVVTTALGLGCANLLREPSRKRRQALLGAAYEAGIRHLDVAPMYGLGRVEAEVGRFVRGRDDVVVATKVGISPTALGRLLAPIQAPLQRAASGTRAGDPRLGAGRLLYRSDRDAMGAVRRSLEHSVRLLGRDQLDIVFVHEPGADGSVADDVAEYLEEARATGLVKTWGAAGEHARECRTAPVVQTRWSRFAARIDTPSERPLIRYGALVGALDRIRAHLRDDDRRRPWTEGLGTDGTTRAGLVTLLLEDALAALPSSPLLFGTTRPDRVAEAAAAASRTEDHRLPTFRALVREIPAGAAG